MSTKVLLLGLDSADRDLLLHWAKSGVMPVLGGLMERGFSADSKMPPGLGVEAMWMSLHTGVNPGRHGVYCYSQIKSGSYEICRLRDGLIKHQPFWETLSENGRRVCIVDAPRVPPSEQLNGIQLCYFMAHAPDAAIESVPPGLAEQVSSHYGAYPLCPCSPPETGGISHSREEVGKVRDYNLRRLEARASLVEELLRQDEWDLFYAALTEFHCVGHDFWHLHDTAHPLYEPDMVATLGDPMEDVYRAADATIGRILECVDDDTTVMLFAGPGVGPNRTASHMLDKVLQRLDLDRSQTAASLARSLRNQVRRFLPQGLRSWLKPHLLKPRDALLSAEYQHRDCFVVNQQAMHGAIRVNKVGREPNGRIKPGADFDRFCRDLAAELLALRNVETGSPVVKEVLRADEVFSGPHLDQLPDILILWDQSTPIRSIESPKIGRLTMDNPDLRSGEHFDRTLFVAHGPGVAAGDHIQTVAVEDIAPTIAQLLGTELPDCEGSPIPGIGVKKALPQ